MDDTGAPVTVPESICRAHLEKISGSVTFLRAEQLRRLLQWLGERALGACRSAPTEREIAAEVLVRSGFNPQFDSLVRKEMCRLREKLVRYYLTEGLQDEVRIRANAGYQLDFAWHGDVQRAHGKHCWLVLPFRSNPDLAEYAGEWIEELLLRLGEGSELELIPPTTAFGYRGRTGDVRGFAAECRADFVVEGSLRRTNESFEASVWLIDGRSGRVRRSKRLANSDAHDLARAAASWLLENDQAKPLI